MLMLESKYASAAEFVALASVEIEEVVGSFHTEVFHFNDYRYFLAQYVVDAVRIAVKIDTKVSILLTSKDQSIKVEFWVFRVKR